MPRPTIEGQVIRRIDMNYMNPKTGSNKDYRITVSELSSGLCNVYTEYGPAGRLQNGKLVAAGVPPSRADMEADKFCRAKIHQSDSYSVDADQRFPSGFTASPQPVPPQASRPQPKAKKHLSAEALSPSVQSKLSVIF